MKKRNIKKYYKKRISSGLREYLSLNVKYSDIGTESKYLSRKMLCELLQLEDVGEDSGFVDHFHFYDPNDVIDGIKQSVNIELRSSFLPEDKTINILEYVRLPEDTLYITDDTMIYYIEGMIGFRNPKCIWDDDNGYPENEPYWLFDDDEELKQYHYVWGKGDGDVPDENVYEILRRFKNNKDFGSDIFSGNFVYGLVSGNFGQDITNNLFEELSNLSEYCKTSYEDFYDDYVELTYAIRYKENVDPFLRDLKKIILKYKIKL